MEDYYPHSFFRAPRFFPYYYRNRNYYRQNITPNRDKENQNEKEPPKKGRPNQDNHSFGNTDSPVFEIFGIQLFFDDILLISLIFFLYNEGVQDQFLFIALILLLLS